MPKSQSEATSKIIKFRRGFKADAERIAAECRRELSLKDFQPLSAFALAGHLKLKVIAPFDIPGLGSESLSHLLNSKGASHWSAVTIGIDKPELIIYNSSHSSSRTESNIMHEAAHVLLEHPMAEIDTTLGIPLRKYDAVQEMEAEWLGACLQLPTPALKKYYVFGSSTVAEIAEIFNASQQMVRYRIGVSGAQAIKSRFK